MDRRLIIAFPYLPGICTFFNESSCFSYFQANRSTFLLGEIQSAEAGAKVGSYTWFILVIPIESLLT